MVCFFVQRPCNIQSKRYDITMYIYYLYSNVLVFLFHDASFLRPIELSKRNPIRCNIATHKLMMNYSMLTGNILNLKVCVSCPSRLVWAMQTGWCELQFFPQTVYCWYAQCFLCPPPWVCLPSCLPAGLGCCVRLPGLFSMLVFHLVSHLGML